MPQDTESLKAEMMKEAENLIDMVLKDKGPAEGIKLSEIEQIAVQVGMKFQQMIAQRLVEDGQVEKEEEVICPGCGERLRVKDYRSRRIETEAGEVEVRRAYYYCQRCQAGFFPLDKRWGLTRSVYSPERARQMVWLSSLVPYEQAAQVFERIGHHSTPSASIWRQAQQHGERLKEHSERQQDFVRVERIVLPPPGQDHRERKGGSMDGGMVHIRGEGWKEMKVGAVFDIDLRLEHDQRTGELVEQAHGTNIAYTGVLGSVDEFAPALWALAVAQDVPCAAQSSVTADGAEWIWNLVADYFPDSIQIVDWYHACQHLSDAAYALYPDDPDQALSWFRRHQTPLFLGTIHQITHPLDQAGLPDHSRYFHTHKRRMQYLTFREEGYPIGSGTVESSIKQFKARLTGPGMRWSRPGAERMLVTRSAVLGCNFDALWDKAA